MRTTCVFKAEITIAIRENWQDSAPVKQVRDDAARMAAGHVAEVREELRKAGIAIGPLTIDRVELKEDK